MPPKSKHKLSALAKAVRTNRHSTPIAAELNTACLDFKSAAAILEFNAEAKGLEGGKRIPGSSNVKTVLAGESQINVDHRVRHAATPLGCKLDDDAVIEEELSFEDFHEPRLSRQLMPKRPVWSFEVSSGRLHHREIQAFKQWLADVQGLIAERGGYPPAFEQNLQVWRQLWRVLERCDVVVVVVDARHPLLHLPPALVYHVSRTLRKPFVIVLNKLDTIIPADAVRWAECLRLGVPGLAGIVGFSKVHVREEDYLPTLRVGKAALIAECHRALAEADTEDRGDGKGRVVVDGAAKLDDAAAAPGDKVDGRKMLGLVGHPNVGKSSLINSLMGSKVVSVKATPGHTKTLQTMVLDAATCLCDSPGVVFPRLRVPREAQIVGMLIPLAQVREPFSAIRWVMERSIVPLQELLSLRPVTLSRVLELRAAGTEALRLDGIAVGDEDGATVVPWSPMLVCAQYATQRGLMRSGGPDCNRAGLEILERVLDGRVQYSVNPPAAIPDAVDAQRYDSDSDSDWQVDDQDYESEPEDGTAPPEDKGLLEYFGIEAKGPGRSTVRSRRRHGKMQEKEEKEEQLAGKEEP